MKNTIIITVFAAMTLTACSKSAIEDNSNGSGTANVVDASSVPAAARTALASNFNGATSVEWQRHSSSSFEAQFNHSSQRHSAGFDDSGNQTSHSVICTDGPVPQVVLDAFRQRFPSDNVYEWKLRNDGTWKAHFMRGSLKYEATYTAAGALLKFEQSA